MKPKFLLLMMSAVLASATLLLVSCDVESADSVYRSVGADVSGVYRNDDGDFVSRNSGNEVTQLDLRQTGDQLEGIDNNGIVFRGTIGAVVDSRASFNLQGRTTAGNAAVISGNIAIGEGEGVMRGTWIEDALYGTVYGEAVGPTIITNQPQPTNTNITIGAVLDLPEDQLMALRYLQASDTWLSSQG